MRVLMLLVLFAQTITIASSPCLAQPDSTLALKLRKQVPKFALDHSTSFIGALIQVSNEFQIPMGISWERTDSTKSLEHLDWNSTTVQTILQDIVATQPGYRLDLQTDIVHIFAPIPETQNFLNLKVGDFAIRNQIVEVASYRLHELVNPSSTGSRQISIAGPDDSKVTIALKDTTVAGVLDAIVVSSKRKIWVVTYLDGAPQLTSKGYRRSGSLWNANAAMSVEAQLSWDLITWGDPVPPLAFAEPPNQRP